MPLALGQSNGLLLLLAAEHVLHDLLLLDEEGADDARAHAGAAARSAVGAGHGALALLEGVQVNGGDAGDLWKGAED